MSNLSIEMLNSIWNYFCRIYPFATVIKRLSFLFSVGVCEQENTRVTFDIVHLAQTHPSCKYLSGILDMFKEKVPYEYKDPATVSVRFTYILKKFPESALSLIHI